MRAILAAAIVLLGTSPVAAHECRTERELIDFFWAKDSRISFFRYHSTVYYFRREEVLVVHFTGDCIGDVTTITLEQFKELVAKNELE